MSCAIAFKLVFETNRNFWSFVNCPNFAKFWKTSKNSRSTVVMLLYRFETLYFCKEGALMGNIRQSTNSELSNRFVKAFIVNFHSCEWITGKHASGGFFGDFLFCYPSFQRSVGGTDNCGCVRTRGVSGSQMSVTVLATASMTVTKRTVRTSVGNLTCF